jgi:apolipoprotein N-acyltransferase
VETSETLSSSPPKRLRGPWYFWSAVAGGLLLWLALPPVNWSPLAWLAPLLWTPIVTRQALAGRRAYLWLYLAGDLFWSAGVYWITLPHWSAAIGWVFLAGYMGAYFPAFFLVSRLAVHRLRVPAELAMPTVWTALELARAYVFTGFLMGALGHTQYRWLSLIQFSDLVGAYGVSFLMMLVSVSVAQALPWTGNGNWRLARILPAALCLAAALVYGKQRLDAAAPPPAAEGELPLPKIALVQGTLDTRFGQTMEEYLAAKDRTYQQYLRLSRDAVAAHPDVALVVWPESMYRRPLVTFHDGAEPEDLDPKVPAYTRHLLAETLIDVGVPMLVAVNGEDHYPGGPKFYNTSLFLDFDATGEPQIAARYDKMHLVPFGEFVPFGDWFPALYKLTPLGGGIERGLAPISVSIGLRGQRRLRVAPNICFETVVPHLMRYQVAELARRGQSPDVLVTQTNDGWFYGSAGLDMHLVCNVFRAIECRKPLVVSANTGISAAIDDCGRILEQLPRRQEGVIVATPRPSVLRSVYVEFGDGFAWACGLASLAFLFAGAAVARVQTRRRRAANADAAGGPK